VPGAIAGVIVVEAPPSPPDRALLWGVAGALAFTSLVTLGACRGCTSANARRCG